jgi:hypothetical protein
MTSTKRATGSWEHHRLARFSDQSPDALYRFVCCDEREVARVTRTRGGWRWDVWRRAGGENAAHGISATRESAQADADAWALANPDKLDWTLPETVAAQTNKLLARALSRALLFLLPRIGINSGGSWDQHLRYEFGDAEADLMVEALRQATTPHTSPHLTTPHHTTPHQETTDDPHRP